MVSYATLMETLANNVDRHQEIVDNLIAAAAALSDKVFIAQIPSQNLDAALTSMIDMLKEQTALDDAELLFMALVLIGILDRQRKEIFQTELAPEGNSG